MLAPIANLLRKPATPARPGPVAPSRQPAEKPRRKPKEETQPRRSPAQERYDAMTRSMLAAYGIKVRKWRKNSSGIARLTTFRDGSIVRTLESPRPTGPMSAAIFLHEVGHHAIGFNVYKPRCLEEYHAWAFAIREMERLGLNITDSVRRRMHRSLKYAIDKARRRGLQDLPPELIPFDRPCPPKASGSAKAPGSGKASGPGKADPD
jgi:hypothetical protein